MQGTPHSQQSIINDKPILLLSRAKAPVPSPRERSPWRRASGLLGRAAIIPDGSLEAAAQPCLHPAGLAALAGRRCSAGAGDNSLLFLSRAWGGRQPCLPMAQASHSVLRRMLWAEEAAQDSWGGTSPAQRASLVTSGFRLALGGGFQAASGTHFPC